MIKSRKSKSWSFDSGFWPPFILPGKSSRTNRVWFLSALRMLSNFYIPVFSSLSCPIHLYFTTVPKVWRFSHLLNFILHHLSLEQLVLIFYYHNIGIDLSTDHSFKFFINSPLALSISLAQPILHDILIEFAFLNAVFVSDSTRVLTITTS